MDSPAPAPQRNPEAEYQRRMEELRAAEAVYRSRDDRLAYTILLLIVSTMAVAIWLLFSRNSLYWAAVPLAIFIFFAVIHSRVLRVLRDCRRAIAFYERGLARLDGRWIGAGQNGERFLDSRSEEHTSELQSHVNLVCRLLLEKKKKIIQKARTVTVLLYVQNLAISTKQVCQRDVVSGAAGTVVKDGGGY